MNKKSQHESRDSNFQRKPTGRRNHTVERNSKKTTQKNEKYRKNQKKKQLSMEGQQICVYGRKNPYSKQLEDLRANPVGKS